MKGCDEEVKQERCEFRFAICRDCYLDCVGPNGGGHCPGCKESYNDVNDEEDEEMECDDDYEVRSEGGDQALPLPNLDKRLSVVKSFKNHPTEFDHTRWLFKTKGTYSYGNVVWPKDGYGIGSEANGFEHPPDFGEKSRRPLTRKVRVSAAIISPYRLLIVMRLASLCLFLTWRIKPPNHEAMWLWGCL